MKNTDNITFVESFVLGSHLINVYLDDAGQCYILEYIDQETGELKEVSCGAYNFNYKWCAEELLGSPVMHCDKYESMKIKNCNCTDNISHGYCCKCKFSDLDYYHLEELIKLGVVDRRLNISKEYKRALNDIYQANKGELV